MVVQPGKTGQMRESWGDVSALPAVISAGVKPKVAHDDTQPVELPDTAHMAEIATLGKTKLFRGSECLHVFEAGRLQVGLCATQDRASQLGRLVPVRTGHLAVRPRPSVRQLV